jgi:hypothetical protein
MRSTSAAKDAAQGATDAYNRGDLERVREVLETIQREMTRPFREGRPSDALGVELLKIYLDVGVQLAAVHRQVEGLKQGQCR